MVFFNTSLLVLSPRDAKECEAGPVFRSRELIWAPRGMKNVAVAVTSRLLKKHENVASSFDRLRMRFR